MSFSDLIATYGDAILGDLAARNNFPLLYKFIFAREKLSVQAHPASGSRLGAAKTECWYVVDAKPGAELIVGVASKGRSRDETLKLLKSPRCEDVLKRWPAKQGDVFFIPAGTVHAITEGLLLYEVQQNSDTTFRLYDWGRIDSKGQSRPLHLEQASEVADLEDRDGYKIPPLRVELDSHSEDYLVACDFFTLIKWHGFRSPAAMKTRARFQVLSVISGSFVLRTAKKDLLSLNLGDTVLVPARQEVQLEAISPGSEMLLSFVPDWNADILEPLRRAGHGDEAIGRLQGPSGIRV